MSVMFLEPAYPPPGHIHQGRLQLVEVCGALSLRGRGASGAQACELRSHIAAPQAVLQDLPLSRRVTVCGVTRGPRLSSILASQGNFRHMETHSAVSREELVMVLAGLEQLQIRALFSQISSAVSLRRVALEVATAVGGGPPASNVELCMCPASYRGDSCQVCPWASLPASIPVCSGPGLVDPCSASHIPCPATPAH